MAKKALIISTSLRGGSNSDLSASEVTAMLSNGDVQLKITR